MSVELCAVGGFGEVGKNMCAVKVDDEVVIFDMGLHMANYVRFTEEEREEVVRLSPKELKRVRAIPDDDLIDDWRGMVKAIVPSHAHLDHVGAVPYLAGAFDAPVIATPFTVNVIKSILKDGKQKLPNKLVSLAVGGKMRLSKKLMLEFLHVTHSTPQTVFVALHTPYGIVLYATDFKVDLKPKLGKPFDMARMEKVLKGKVLVAIVDSLYAADKSHTPSESVAQEMLSDVLLNTDVRQNALVVTTFSSHIARIKSIIECARSLGRRPVLLGRSMAKYAFAALDAGIYDVTKAAEVARYGSQVRRFFNRVEREGRQKYLLIVTGHQGEPKAMLTRMVEGSVPFRLKKNDVVVFSCNVIPVPVNIEHRERLESRLKDAGVRMFKDIHVSGHAAREDMRDLIRAIQPKHIVPVHSAKAGIEEFCDLGAELGYSRGKNVHSMYVGGRLKLV